MATELNMPQMGYDMQEGTVVRWLKSEGAEVKIGEAIAEIETDKAVVEFESIASGVLRQILVAEGTTVPVGEAIGLVADAGEDLPETPAGPGAAAPDATPPEAAAEAAPAEAAQAEVISVTPPSTQSDGIPTPAREVRASPIARRLAEEKGFDLRQIKGTGPGERITRDDVLAYQASLQAAEAAAAAEPAVVAEAPLAESAAAEEAAAARPAPASAAPAQTAGEKVPLTRMRQQIARVTVRSKQETPHFYVSAEIDMTQAMELRRQINSLSGDGGLRVTVNDLIIKACVGALKTYPKFNAYFAGDGIQMNEAINVGIAIAEEEGLIVPAIMDCAGKSLQDIAAASKDLAERAKSGTLHPQEYSGGTFSISNLGMFDVSGFAAIIQPPQSAVLAVGTVGKRPVVKDGQVTVAEMMTATISADHRVADGAEGAQFIVEVKRLLETPASLLM